MGSGCFSAGFRQLRTSGVARSVRCFATGVNSPLRSTRTGSLHRQQLATALRGDKGVTAAQSTWQLPSRQTGGRLHVATRLHSLRAAGTVAASSAAPMQRKVSHILLKADESELLDDIEKKIADGEDFKLLAAEYSNCGSSVKGGLVGWIEKGKTAVTFEEAVYEADIGELVRAETHFGLHLIKVEAERQQAGIVQMPVTELARILQDPQEKAKYQFIDVREPAEEAIARIKQFQLFPLTKLREWGPSLKKNLDVAKPTVVMCHHGVRSQQAAQYLESEGFAQLNNVKGGIHEYSVVVDPTVPVY